MLGVFDIQCSFFGGLNSRQKRNSNRVKFENRCSLITHMQVNGCEVTEKELLNIWRCPSAAKIIKKNFSMNLQPKLNFKKKIQRHLALVACMQI